MKNYCKVTFCRIIATGSVLLICFIYLLSGCGGGGGDGGGGGIDDDGGNSVSMLDQPITDNDKAGICVSEIHAAVGEGMSDVVDELANGTHSGTVINCITGTATVDGTRSFLTNISCGSMCVKNTQNVDVTIVFNNCNWKNFTNGNITINGSIHYYRNSWSRQSNLSYSSSDSRSMSSVTSPVQFRQVIDGTWGYKDSITFSASGSNPYLLHGTLTAQNGVTYTF
jgi:hypothetical protein